MHAARVSASFRHGMTMVSLIRLEHGFSRWRRLRARPLVRRQFCSSAPNFTSNQSLGPAVARSCSVTWPTLVACISASHGLAAAAAIVPRIFGRSAAHTGCAASAGHLPCPWALRARFAARRMDATGKSRDHQKNQISPSTFKSGGSSLRWAKHPPAGSGPHKPLVLLR